METKTTILSVLLAICFGLSGWSLSETVAMKTEVATLKAEHSGDTRENDRRFGELNTKLDEMKTMLRDALRERRRTEPGKDN